MYAHKHTHTDIHTQTHTRTHTKTTHVKTLTSGSPMKLCRNWPDLRVNWLLSCYTFTGENENKSVLQSDSSQTETTPAPGILKCRTGDTGVHGLVSSLTASYMQYSRWMKAPKSRLLLKPNNVFLSSIHEGEEREEAQPWRWTGQRSRETVWGHRRERGEGGDEERERHELSGLRQEWRVNAEIGDACLPSRPLSLCTDKRLLCVWVCVCILCIRVNRPWGTGEKAKEYRLGEERWLLWWWCVCVCFGGVGVCGQL